MIRTDFSMRPMLAATVDDVSKLVFPLIATPKIDGIRCLTLPYDGHPDDGLSCSAVTRTLKPIPNGHIRNMIERNCSPGLDGELIVPNATFQESVSCIMSHQGMPEFVYNVFDHIDKFKDPKFAKGIMEKYEHRLVRLHRLHKDGLPNFIQIVPSIQCFHLQKLEEFEEMCISKGYEGICLRSPHSPYKFGRSSMREHWLMKLKRFEESEAVVKGWEELMHNKNIPEKNALGYNERNSHAALMVPGNTLGALIVYDVNNQVEFNIGTGFSQLQRDELWKNRDFLLGRVLTYKHQPHGRKDKPRTPVFKGFRTGTIT